MKKKTLISTLLILMIMAPGFISAQVYRWVYEERGTANQEWEYMWSGVYGIDSRQSIGNDAPMSLTNYSGTASLKLNYTHVKGTNYAYYEITTSADGTGREASSWPDSDAGKDISSCDALDFFIKTSNASSPNTIWIAVQDTAGLKTDKILINNYQVLNDTAWHEVIIPLDKFSWVSGVNKASVRKINFYIEQYDPSGHSVLYVDNIKFTNANLGASASRFKIVFEDSWKVDSTWNYSSTWLPNGLMIENSGDLPVSTNEKYQGNTSLKLHVTKTVQTQYGTASFTGTKSGTGNPPTGWGAVDYDLPKNISSYSSFNFWIKGDTNTVGRIELADASGNKAVKIKLSDWVWVTNEWQKAVIPFSRIQWGSFDKTSFKDISWVMGADEPVGEYTCYLDNMEFTSEAGTPTTVPRKVAGINIVSGIKQIALSWKNVPDEDGYKIFRNTANIFPGGAPLAVSPWSNSSYKDNGPFVKGQTYYYWILATNTVGSSPNSDSASVTFTSNIPWIYDEGGNHNSQWECVNTWEGGADSLEKASGNIPVSSISTQVSSSLKLHFTHTRGPGNYAGCNIFTSSNGFGNEPSDWIDATNKAHDISRMDALQFFIKAANPAGVNQLGIKLIDKFNRETSKLLLSDYITINDTGWHAVQIPLHDFNIRSGVDLTQMRKMGFLIAEDDLSGDWTLYIDKCEFASAGLPPASGTNFKLVNEDTGGDLKWDFSGSTTNGSGGLNFELTAGNLPVSTNEHHQGYSSLKLHVNKSLSSGWGYGWFSCNSNGYGTPPSSGAEYDAPKNISGFPALSFWIKGDTNTVGRIELVDIHSNVTAKIDLLDWVHVTNRWQKVVIPADTINWQSFNRAQLQKIDFGVDSDQPTGDFTCYIDQMEFTNAVTLPSSVPPQVPSLTATVAGNNKILLSWKPVLLRDGYKIFRNTSPGLPALPFTNVAYNTTAFADKNLQTGTVYYYWVVAYNSAGDAAPSPSASATNSADIKWIYDEGGNHNGEWEFGGVWTNSPDHFGVTNGNVPVSTTNMQNGHGIKLHFKHARGFYSVVGICTSTNGLGNEPSGQSDADKGKDLTGADAIQFYVRTEDNTKSNEFRIKLVDENNQESSHVFSRDYIKLNDTDWHLVQIPMDDFSWAGIDRSKIKRVDFVLQQYDPSDEWTMEINNLKFTHIGLAPIPKFKWISEAAGDLNMRWGYSGVSTNDTSGGLNIDLVNATNIPVSTNEFYKNRTSLKVHVNKHSSSGYGYIWISCHSNGSGTPPNSWDNYNAPKNMAPYKNFSFWIKGSTNSKGRLEFGDVDGKVCTLVNIRNYAKVSNAWQQIVVPLSGINWGNCSPHKLKQLNYIVDKDMAVGDFTNYIDEMIFSGAGSGVFGSAEVANNLKGVFEKDHIKLTWTPNTSSYIAGYEIAYSFTNPGTNGTGLAPANSPMIISEKNTSTLNITGFKAKDILWFAIRTVDTSGGKSAFSPFIKVVCLPSRALGAYPNYLKSEDAKTEIWFETTKQDDVALVIYNTAGQQVWNTQQVFPEGLNKVDWFKKNKSGQLVSSGVYIIRVKGGGVDTTTKIILIK